MKVSAISPRAKDAAPAQPSEHRRSQTENVLVIAPSESDDSPSPVLLPLPPDRLGDLWRDARALLLPCSR